MQNFTIILYFSDRCLLCTRYKIQSNNKVQTLSHITHLWMCYSIYLFIYVLLLTQNILHDSRINVTYQNQREKKCWFILLQNVNIPDVAWWYIQILSALLLFLHLGWVCKMNACTQTVLWHILYYCTQMHQ